MMKMYERGVQSWFEYVKENLEANQIVGIDFSQYPASPLDNRVKYFKEADITVQSVPNLVDLVWADERPARPTNPAKELAMEFCGKSSLDK